MVFNSYNTFTTSREREIGSLSRNAYKRLFKKPWRFSLKFDQNLAIENIKKHMILALLKNIYINLGTFSYNLIKFWLLKISKKHMILVLLISNIPFWLLYITSKESQPWALRSWIWIAIPSSVAHGWELGLTNDNYLM